MNAHIGPNGLIMIVQVVPVKKKPFMILYGNETVSQWRRADIPLEPKDGSKTHIKQWQRKS